MEPRAVRHHCNFHVLNILPVTTFRTIDLEGKKSSGPLFSRFCAKESSFFCTYKRDGQRKVEPRPHVQIEHGAGSRE